MRKVVSYNKRQDTSNKSYKSLNNWDTMLGRRNGWFGIHFNQMLGRRVELHRFWWESSVYFLFWIHCPHQVATVKAMNEATLDG